MKSLLLILLVPLLPFSAKAIQVEDIILFPVTITSGRVFRTLRTSNAVGLVRELAGNVLTVQEINYPTRQGSVVYRPTPQGEVLYYGTHEVPLSSPDIIPLIDQVTTPDGTSYTRGSRFRIPAGRSRLLGYVLYVFTKGSTSYVAVTDEKGWQCYQQYGEACHEKAYVRLVVRRIGAHDLNID